MSGNPLMKVFDADLNSDHNRAILRYLLVRIGYAVTHVFPTRATVCYGALVTGFALAFIPVAKDAPARFTLITTLVGAGLVAVSAHELDELQDDIDEAKRRKSATDSCACLPIPKRRTKLLRRTCSSTATS